MLGFWFVLDEGLWVQPGIVSGWVAPYGGQVTLLLDWECSVPSHFLPLLGVERGRAPWVLGGTVWLALLLWIESLATAAAWVRAHQVGEERPPQSRGLDSREVAA